MIKHIKNNFKKVLAVATATALTLGTVSLPVLANEEEYSLSQRIKFAKDMGVTEYMEEDGYLDVAYSSPLSFYEMTELIPILRFEDMQEVLERDQAALNRTYMDLESTMSEGIELIESYSVTSYSQVHHSSNGFAAGKYMGYTPAGVVDLFCGDNAAASPGSGVALTDLTLVTNTDVLKALYYGYNGPESIESASIDFYIETANAISEYLYGNGYSQSAAFRETISKLDVPPNSFTAYICTTNGGATQPLLFSMYEPQGMLSLKKVSASPEITDGSDCYSLEGAEYGVYTTKTGASNNTSSTKVGTLTTKADGSTNTLELDAGTYYVKELVAPKGYQLDPIVYTVEVVSNETNAFTVADDPHYDPIGMVVTKVDADTGEAVGTGSGELAGAEFTIKFYNTHGNISGLTPTRTWVFATDEDGYARYSDLYKVSGDALYYYDGIPYLPLGTITIQETKAPTGYLVDPTVYTRVIELDATLESVRVDNVPEVKEQVIRGDLDLIKIEETTMQRMEGIPFQITSQSTGESHIIVTDVNGYASTHADWNPHNQNTNKGETDKDGVWFGELDALDNTKGALPYDTYLIEELPCENNANHDIFAPFTITISRDNYTVSLGTITNDSNATVVEIDTVASDLVTGSHMGLVNEEITIEDDVTLSGLTPGVQYRIEGILMNKNTRSPFYTLNEDEDTEAVELKYPVAEITMGDEVRTSYTFEAKSNWEVHTLDFTFKGSDITKVTDIVVFEYVYVEDELVAEHTDFDDTDQTVTYANTKIGTKASAPNYYEPGDIAEVKDVVMYDNVIANSNYSIEGILMDKDTEEPFVINGEVVTSTLEFVPSEAEGEVELNFSFEITEAMGDLNLVVFETMYNEEGHQVAEHTDIKDVDQTVLIRAMDIDIPKTGDNNNVIWLMQLLFLSFAVGVMSLRRSKK